ncbi:hypothetical protein MSS4_03381 [Mycobacterium marinum]|nr:hypothetical protein MSS4_03381 [Mycobacterium marinum]
MEPPGVSQRELNCALSPTSDSLTVHVTSTRLPETVAKEGIPPYGADLCD